MIYFTSASEWKLLADTLKDILTDSFFVFKGSTITMNNVDPEKIVEVHYILYPDLDSYNCTTTFVFPVYIQTIYRVLRGVKNTDRMQMEDLCDGSLHMKVFAESGMLKNEISLKPLQQEMPTFIRNPREYDMEVSFNNEQLYHILHDLSALSRQVTISVKDQVISFQAQDESGTTSNYSQQFNTIDPTYFFSNTYLIKFLEKFTKPGIHKFATLQISHSLPFNVAYHLPTGFLELSIAGLE
jgi:hypothetical protein